jgi:hypothetical protein
MDLTALALMSLVIAVIVSRVLAGRSLPLLTIEQKASVMDETAKGNIWPLVALLVVIILPWPLALAQVASHYIVGAVTTFLFAVLLLSLGAAATRLVRLSRLSLPRPYFRSLIYGTSLVHAAVLFLIIAFAVYGSHEFHR